MAFHVPEAVGSDLDQVFVEVLEVVLYPAVEHLALEDQVFVAVVALYPQHVLEIDLQS